MGQRFWVSSIVAAVLFCLLGFLVHETILHNDYAQVPGIFRTSEEALRRMPIMFVAYLLMGFAATWIYRQGITAGASWLLQGIRFGLAVALVSAVPMYLIYYAVQPLPVTLVVKQIVLQTIAIIIVGIVIAWINRRGSIMTV
jgi:hypothetical protein